MEEWRSITGYDGYYEVSNTGKVRSLDRVVVRSDGVHQVRKGKLKSLFITPDGYLDVKLSMNGQDRRYGIHYLVAREFVDGFEDGLEVNHKDYNRKNNQHWNLEWVTHKQNIQHTIDGKRHITQIRDMSGTNNPNYGNRSLSAKYSKNKALSIEKQSRPGSKNGRARVVIMTSPSGNELTFECIKYCAQHLIDTGVTRCKDVYSVSAYISQAAEKDVEYYRHKFRFQ